MLIIIPMLVYLGLGWFLILEVRDWYKSRQELKRRNGQFVARFADNKIYYREDLINSQEWREM